MSNNFVTPRAVATLSQSRIDYNNSLLALLQNFSSSGQPSASSVNLEGVSGLKQGMLWYKAGSNTADGQGRLTIYDGANFVRTGVAVYRMPSSAVANVAIGNNKITSGELIDIGDNRLYMVNSSNTGFVDIGLPPIGYTVDNAQTLDNLDSTQFLRSDVADTIEGPLTGNPMLRLTNTSTNSLSVASLWLSGDSGTLLLDNDGSKRIAWNDGASDFGIKVGSYVNGPTRYTTTGDGAVEINITNDDAHGQITLRVSDIGTAEATPVWTQTLMLSNTGLALNSNTIWNAGNDGSGSGLDADTLDGTQLVTIQGAYAANDGVTLATARGNDHSTLLSARANDLSTYNTLVSEYRANDWNTLASARSNDHATLLSAQANDVATLLTARGNDHATYNTLVSEYRANDWNTFSTLSANDGATLSTAIANDFSTFTTLSANDFNTLSSARANDGATLATARGNDHTTLLTARANDFSTFTTLNANTFNTFSTLSANDGVVRSLAIANDYNGYLTFRGEFLGNDHTTLLTARANDFSTFTTLNANTFNTWNGLQNFANLKANIASPTFTGEVRANDISSDSENGRLVITGGINSSGGNIELYGPTHPTNADRIYYDAFAHTFRSNTNAVRLNIDSTGNVGIGVSTATANLHVLGDIRATTQLLGNANDSAASPAHSWHLDTDTGMFRQAADVIGISTGGIERIRITSTGNVGIGVNPPTANLHVLGDIRATTQLLGNANDSAASPAHSWHLDTDTGMFRQAADVIGISTGGIERIRVASTGNVGIGISATSANLHVAGDIRATTRFIGNAADTPTSPTYTWDQDDNTGFYRSSADIIGVATGGKPAAEFTNTGNLRIYNSTGTFYTELQSEPTSNASLIIPAGGTVNLSLGTMATTDSTQTISGSKTFTTSTTISVNSTDALRLNKTANNQFVGIMFSSENSNRWVQYLQNNADADLLFQARSNDGSVAGSVLSLRRNTRAVQTSVDLDVGRDLAVTRDATISRNLTVISNVGIGISATSANLHVAGDIRATTRFLGNAADSNTSPSYSWDTDTNTGIYSPAADTLGITTNGLERLRITSTGNVAIGRSTADTLVDVQGPIRTSAGIVFGTDLAVSANLLDDYEEGTWTVEVYDSATGLASPTTATGVYTKIGSLVFASFGNLNNINLAGFTGANTISISLPFVSIANGGATGSVILDTVTYPSNSSYISIDLGINTNRAQFRSTGNNIVDSLLTVSNFTSNTSDIVRYSITYRAV
jgi:hypothetical protein